MGAEALIHTRQLQAEVTERCWCSLPTSEEFSSFPLKLCRAQPELSSALGGLRHSRPNLPRVITIRGAMCPPSVPRTSICTTLG